MPVTRAACRLQILIAVNHAIEIINCIAHCTVYSCVEVFSFLPVSQATDEASFLHTTCHMGDSDKIFIELPKEFLNADMY